MYAPSWGSVVSVRHSLAYAKYRHGSASMNTTDTTVLLSLDISAAFVSINHGVLLDCISQDIGIRDIAFNWLAAFVRF